MKKGLFLRKNLYFCQNLQLMATDIRQQIERVQSKMNVLGERYASLKAAYDEARSQISDLKAQLLARDEQLKQLNIKVENLTVASNVGTGAQDLDDSKALIADLIREIDRCIADILE